MAPCPMPCCAAASSSRSVSQVMSVSQVLLWLDRLKCKRASKARLPGTSVARAAVSKRPPLVCFGAPPQRPLPPGAHAVRSPRRACCAGVAHLGGRLGGVQAAALAGGGARAAAAAAAGRGAAAAAAGPGSVAPPLLPSRGNSFRARGRGTPLAHSMPQHLSGCYHSSPCCGIFHSAPPTPALPFDCIFTPVT